MTAIAVTLFALLAAAAAYFRPTLPFMALASIVNAVAAYHYWQMWH